MYLLSNMKRLQTEISTVLLNKLGVSLAELKRDKYFNVNLYWIDSEMYLLFIRKYVYSK